MTVLVRFKAFFARLWRAFLGLTRTITIGRLAAAYVVALILVFVSLFVMEGAVGLSHSPRPGFGIQVIFFFGAVGIWSGILVFVAFTAAGLVRLGRSVMGVR